MAAAPKASSAPARKTAAPAASKAPTKSPRKASPSAPRGAPSVSPAPAAKPAPARLPVIAPQAAVPAPVTTGTTEYLTDADIYRRVIQDELPSAKRLLWIGTADLKDLHVPRGKRAIPLLQVISELIDRGVEVRLLHAKEPGPIFKQDFARFPNLKRAMETMLCPRVHFKIVVVDERFAYSGSANLTGAGLGAKSDRKRNFEAGIVTTDRTLVKRIMRQFDEVWMGKPCATCGRTEYCSARIT
jgi:phosphatidylserine/phosphatidylglycerophosphate/cardiolipin synthase-like enzyme